MEKQSTPAPDAAHLALRCCRASRLLASLRRSRASDRRGPSPAAVEFQSDVLIHRGEVSAARREAAAHARVAGSELLLVLAVAPAILLLLFLFLGLLPEAP